MALQLFPGRRFGINNVFKRFLGPGKGRLGPTPDIYDVSGPWKRAPGPKTSDFTRILDSGKGRRAPTFHILRRFWALRKDGGAQNLVFYDDFGPWERAVGPKTSWFTMVLGPGKGRWSPTPRILRRFWALGKGGGAQHLVFYEVFGPTNGKPPKTAQSGPKPTDFDHFLSFRALSGG